MEQIDQYEVIRQRAKAEITNSPIFELLLLLSIEIPDLYNRMQRLKFMLESPDISLQEILHIQSQLEEVATRLINQ